jgi:hypothetical protein
MKQILTQVGSILAAFLASACCIVPVVGMALGIGGLGIAASMHAYRPYLLVITFIFIGLAFYGIYRRGVVCEDEEECSPNQKYQRWMLWITTVIALIFLAYPYFM